MRWTNAGALFRNWTTRAATDDRAGDAVATVPGVVFICRSTDSR
jgi:hypothetical protein